MPLVHITLRAGHSPEFVHDIGTSVHEALVAQVNVPPDDRFQIFHVVEPHQLVAHATYGGVERSDGLVVIEITLNAGRTLEVKRALNVEC